ncbi:MAG: coenzyme A pyrophosphatase [Betaproteobacteria bacterium]|nr:CoA pyrophosphatase [Rhodocyclaceae bacterium]
MPLPGRAAQVSESWIRRRFAEAVADVGPSGDADVTPTLSGTPASVLVPLVRREHGLTVLLTQRTAHLADHAGQVAFPGGRAEEADSGPEATALREAEEEVGIRPEQVEILGRLSRYRTGSGFLVTPVVGIVTPPLNLRLDDFEVADVFEPPLSFLMDPGNHQYESAELRGEQRQFYSMPWEGYYIWGATAGMLVGLYRFLMAESS